MKQKNKLYKNCKMHCYYSDDTATDITDCEVRFEGNQVIIDYIDDDLGKCLWRGIDEEGLENHYVCKKEIGGSGDATLHCFPKGTIFEGYWEEKEGNDIYDGMWRIILGK